MLKKIVILAASFLLVGAAHAQNLIYKDTVGKVFSIEHAREVRSDVANGAIIVISDTGESSYTYLKDNGTVFNYIKLGNSHWIAVGSDRILNPNKARWIVCDSSGTNFGWRNSGSESLYDGCVAYQQLLTKVRNP